MLHPFELATDIPMTSYAHLCCRIGDKWLVLSHGHCRKTRNQSRLCIPLMEAIYFM
ncbi:hypothetical protein KP509_11G059800 [Ceratopteris richardii]|uniref:Uncharacterized protein n=1 Tax=Ceratopteris richardii TaxID=49495 RepID=A0A8T2TT01_CERRI|nr:hypothetical protein KP509_11G059800 [Ceratopteris richardii]